jgi:hypothetical protein
MGTTQSVWLTSAATAAPHEKHISDPEDPELFRHYFDALLMSI